MNKFHQIVYVLPVAVALMAMQYVMWFRFRG